MAIEPESFPHGFSPVKDLEIIVSPGRIDKTAEHILQIHQLMGNFYRFAYDIEGIRCNLPYLRVSFKHGVEILINGFNDLNDPAVFLLADSKDLTKDKEGHEHIEVRFARLDVPTIVPGAAQQSSLSAHLTLYYPVGKLKDMLVIRYFINRYTEADIQRGLDFFVTGNEVELPL